MQPKSFKMMFMVMVTIAGGQALAGAGDEAIYNALNVREEGAIASRLVTKLQKSVGGLTCFVTFHQSGEKTYECSLSEPADAAAIYAALNAEEESGIASRLVQRYQKTAGGLTCMRSSSAFDSGPEHFDCHLEQSENLAHPPVYEFESPQGRGRSTR